jgi:hypothetical protein
VALDALQDQAHRQLDVLVDEAQPASACSCAATALVHLQRHLAVLARVLRGALHVDLRERDLAAPLPHRSS